MRFPFRFFAAATVLLFVGLNTKSFSATVTLTMQDSSFGTQVNDGGDFFNQNASELGMWANTGNKRTAGWANFGQSGFGGTARNLQVGDTIQITVAATRAFGQIGFSLNAGGTQGTSYDNKTSGSRLFVNTDNYGSWYVGGLNANGLGTSSFSYTPVIDSVRDYQFKVYITSGNTADVELLVNTGTGFTSHTTLRNLTLGGGTDAENITALSIYGSDMWDGNSNDNAWWKNSSITDVGTVNLNYSGTGTFDPGLIADGQAANGAGNTANAVNIGGAAGSAVLLNQNNTFTGLTTVNADATARASHAGAFGTTALGTTVTSGGSIELSGGITIGAEALTLNGTGVGGSGGALRNTSSGNTWQGNVTISSNSRINSDSGTLTLSGTVAGSGNNMFFGGSGNTTLSGAVSGTLTTGNGAIFKDGSGTLTLSANNTGLTGLIRLREGTISIANGNSLGSGAIELGNGNATATLLASSGTTIANRIEVADSGSAGVINVASGQTAIFTGILSQTNGTVNTTKIGKDGAGTLVFNNGSATYNGQIQIGNGSVVAGATGALGTNTSTGARGIDLGFNVGDVAQANNVSLLASNGVTVGQSIYVAPSNNATRTIGLSGTGTATFSNEIYMDANLAIQSGSAATDGTVLSGKITQNATGTAYGLTKSDAGILTLSGSGSDFRGGFTLGGGTLRINNANALGTGTFTISGTSTIDNTTAAAITLGGNNVQAWNGDFTFTGTQNLNLGTGNVTLGATRQVTVSAGTLTVGGIISGSGFGVTKAGAGTLALNGQNSFTGTLTVNAGTVTLGSASRLAGTSSTTIGGGTLTLGGNEGINAFTITSGTLGGSGILTASTYALQGGNVNVALGVGAITVSGNTTTLGSANRFSSSASLAINSGQLTLGGAESVAALSGSGGTLALGGNTLTTTSTTDTSFAGAITGTGGALTKAGTGKLTLTGASSTYTGATTINAGVLNVQNASALGTTAAGTAVSSGAALELQGGISVGAEALSLSGTGVSSGGALRNISGNNTYGGLITLGAASQINSDLNTLTLDVASGNAITGAFNLTFGGAGYITVADPIAISTGTLTKTGAGVLTLSAANTYTGTTTVSAGELALGAANVLSDSTAVSVSAGKLNLGANNDTVSSFTLSGTGTLDGTGTLTASTYALQAGTVNALLGNGAITVSSGTTGLGSAGRLHTFSTLTINSGQLTLGGAETVASLAGSGGTLAMGGNGFSSGGANSDTTFSGVLTGTGAFTKTGTGTLTMGGNSTGYTGKTAISGGAISVSAAGNLGANPGTAQTDQLTLSSGGKLNVTTGFTGNANAGITIGTGGGAIDVASGQTFIQAGGLNGSAALSKTGAGTLTLNTTAGGYNGTMTISAGIVRANTSLTSATVTVANGGKLGGSGSLGAVTVQSGGRLTPGNSPGNLTVSSLTLDGGSGYDFEITNVTGAAGTDWDLVTVGGGTGTVTINATSGSKHTIYLIGNPTGWNVASSFSWQFIDAGSFAGSGFSADAFAFDTSGWTGTSPTGSWSVSNPTGGDLYLNYTAAQTTFNLTVAANATQTQSEVSGGNATLTGATAALNKLGAGILVLTNSANSYGGTTTVKEGTLRITVAAPSSSNGALGNANNAVVIGDTAAAVAAGFDFGAAVDNGRGLSVVSGTGAATRTISTSIGSGTATQSGTIGLGANTDFSVNSGSTLTVSGVISGSSSLTTTGAGTLNLTAANTFTGTLNANTGTVTLGSAGRLASGSSVSLGGGTLTLGGNESVTGFTITSGTLNGSGTLTASTYTLSGGTLTANLGAGTATASTGTTSLNGTLGANLTVSGGTVNLGSANRISDTATVTVSSGTLGMGANNDTVSSFTLSGGTLGGSGTLTASTYTLSGGTLTANLGAGAATAGTGTTALNGTLAGDLTVSGGTVNLGSSDRISGTSAVSISSGTLGMGSNNDTVSSFTISGGTLGGSGTLTASTYTLSGGTLTANLGAGSATASTGTTSLNGTLGANLTVSGGTVNLGSADRISNSATVEVSSGTLGLGANNDTVSSFTLSGGTLGGSGTLTASTYTLSGGTLTANLGAGAATASTGTTSLNGTLGANLAVSGGTVNLGSANRISDSATVTISSGTLGLGANNDTVSTFTLSGGMLDGTGTLTASSYALQGGTLNAVLGAGSITVSSGTTTLGSVSRLNSSSALAVNSGQLTLGGNESVAALSGTGGTIALGANTLTTTSNSDSSAAAAITGTGGALTKAGTGNLTLSGNSSYTGATAVNAGTLTVAHGNALGTTAGNTVVANNATVAFTSGVNSAEAISIVGSGVGSGGAIRNVSGNNTNSGTITMTGSSRINSDAGNLQLGSIEWGNSTNNLTVGGVGTTTITGGINNTATSSRILKDGAGTLVISNNGTTGNAQMQVANGKVTLAAGSFSTSTSTDTRALDLGLDAGDQSSTTDAAFYVNEGVTMSNSIYVAPAGAGGAGLRTLGTESTSGTATFNREIYLGGDLRVSAASGGTAVFSGAITNSGALTKIGAGTVTLSGANTFGGNVTVNEGTLNLSGGSAINNTNAVTIAGGTLQVSTTETVGSLAGTGGTLALGSNGIVVGGNNSSTSFAGLITGSGSFSKNGTGAQTLSGNSTGYSGEVILNDGTLLAGNAGAFGTGTVTINYDSGTGTRTLASSGAAAYTLNNNFNLYFNAFTLGQTAGGTGSLTLGGAGKTFNIGSDGVATTRVVTVNGTHTIAGVVEGGANNRLAVAGGGTLTLTGANTFSGGSQINNGTLLVGNNAALGTGTLTFDFADGTGTRALASASSAAYTLNNNFNLYFNNLTLGQTTGGTGSLTLGGSGKTFNLGSDGTETIRVVTLNGSHTIAGVVEGGANNRLAVAGGGTLTLSGVNTFSGGIQIREGTLRIGHNNALGSGALRVQFDQAGTRTLASSSADARTITNNVNVFNSLTIGQAEGGTGSLTLSGTVYLGDEPNEFRTLTVNGNHTISGAVTGNRGIQKWGAGTLTLSGANTSTGNILIDDGVINLNGGSLGAGTIEIGANVGGETAATLRVSSGSFARNITVNSTGTAGERTIDFANTTGTTTLSGNVALEKEAKFTVASGGTGVLSGAISGGGAMVKQGSGVLTLSGNNNSTGAFYIDDGVFNLNGGTLGAGTIEIGAGTIGASAATLRVSSGSFSRSITVNSDSGAGDRTIDFANTTGTATLSGAVALEKTATVSVASGGAGELTGAVTGAGGISKSGSGRLTLNNANNTYSGGTALSAGQLRLGNAAAAGTGTITQTSGSSTLEIDTTGTVANAMEIYNVQTLKTVTLSGSKTLRNATYDVAASTTTTESGTLSGDGGITKNGTGTLVVSGSSGNTFTGTSAVNAGTLQLQKTSGNSISGSSIAVNSGGTLLLGANNQISDTTAVTMAGGTLSINGKTDTVGRLSVSANSIFDFGSTVSGTTTTFTFADFDTAGYNGLSELTFSNVATGTSIVFNTNYNGNTTFNTFTSKVQFGGGTGQFGQISFGENTTTLLVAIPDARVYSAAVALLVLIGVTEYRRRRRPCRR